MAAEAQAQAKQLDSVTDVVQDTELDASKAQQAMLSALQGGSGAQQAADGGVATLKVNRDDVALIVQEFDGTVTDDMAERTLREVYAETRAEGDALLEAALRRLLTA